MRTRLYDLLADQIKPDPVITVDTTNGLRISANKHTNPVKDVINAYNTLDDDPTGNKRKALVNSAALAGSLLGSAYLKHKYPNLIKPSNARTLKETALKHPVLTLLGAALPVVMYYRHTHKDTPENISKGNRALGAFLGVSIPGFMYEGKRMRDLGEKPKPILPQTDSFAEASAITAANALPYIAEYNLVKATDRFQELDDAERLKAIAADPKLSPEQRDWLTKQITEKRDAQSRYPLLRWTPGGEYIREAYNKHYNPLPNFRPASDLIKAKIRE